MKSPIQVNAIIPSLLITLALLCLGLLPKALAVVPAPDGGYPGGNTAEGQNALLSRTTGGFNTAVGWFSLESVTTGSYNTGVGAGTLVLNSADQNTATGAAALLLNTTGSFNTANGALALLSNTTGHNNTAIGSGALQNNTEGESNTAIGEEALFFDTTGYANTATGSLALFVNNGIQNTANGQGALGNNSTGNANTAIGNITLFNNTTGSENIALGILAGDNVTTANDVICIGAPGANVSNSCFIGQIFNATSSGGTAVFINSNGRLGTSTSSQRFKEEIKPMERASETLFALRPVTFRYRKGIDPQRIPQFGLVAEDVEAVNRDLVVRDKEGKPYSVRYDQVNAMLLNEFLKEHRKVEEQQATIAQLKRDIETIVAHSKEQDSQIQRVRDQVQMNRPDAGVVVSNH
jgi:Chaperone of endosialidase